MKPLEWLLAHVGHEGEGCLTWPFGLSNGYAGKIKVGGRGEYAYRAMCRLAKGGPPTPRHQAGHSCGRGHLGCIHPRHLSWKTPGENQLDRAAHGTRNVWSFRGKITQAQADEIRALKGVITQRELAERFGISRSNVSFIHCGKAWVNHNDGSGPQSDAQRSILKIVSAATHPLSAKQVQAANIANRNATNCLLSKLARRGLIERVARGQYRAIAGGIR